MAYKVYVTCFAVEDGEEVPNYVECKLKDKTLLLPVLEVSGKKTGEFEKALRALTRESMAKVLK